MDLATINLYSKILPVVLDLGLLAQAKAVLSSIALDALEALWQQLPLAADEVALYLAPQ